MTMAASMQAVPGCECIAEFSQPVVAVTTSDGVGVFARLADGSVWLIRPGQPQAQVHLAPFPLPS